MKVLLIGSGGREHALAWKLAKSEKVSELFCTPGSPGIARYAELSNVIAEDVDGIVALVRGTEHDLVVVGPEAPLVLGLADKLRSNGVATFGPSAAAARIEGSKSWANDLMGRYDISCPQSRTFDNTSQAIQYVESQPQGAVVVKVDGLAAGKGVTVPNSPSETVTAITDALDRRVFGDAGSTIVIEERLTGPELSVFAFVDGETVSAPVAARDYKRAYEGDAGANTGGMGAYTSPYLCPADDLGHIRATVLEPIARALVAEGCPYQGILYAGLMLTDDGPQVIEFNCRFGDPECEPLMLRLDSDLAEICAAVAEGCLSEVPVVWNDRSAVGVVLVSSDYPADYETGYLIEGDLPDEEERVVFHAGTSYDDSGRLITSGGRVMVATASSPVSVEHARVEAYSLASGIKFTRFALSTGYRSGSSLKARADLIFSFSPTKPRP